MKVCIHRGSEQIGGSCIEVESQGQRLLIDCGLPLDATGNPRQHLPASLRLDGPPIAAVVISHGHLDHYGLLAALGGDIPVAMGAAGRRILAAAAPFMGRWRNKAVPAGWDLCARKPMQVGPFTVTPYQVDHSAYDAYALLIEADGRRLFYSGDFRMHGRKARVMEALMSRPPKDIDALLVEGSSFGRMEPAGAFPSEQDIEGQMLDAFQRTPGMALVHVSAQNIDRVVSIFRASKRSGRTLVIDLYAAAIFAATDNQHIPQSHWNEVALFIPQRQRERIKNRKLFDLLHAHDAHRIYPQHLKRDPGRYTLLFRSLHMNKLIHRRVTIGQGC